MILKHKGIDIHYKIDGKGPALLLLHGFLENRNMWDPFIPHLSKKNTVISIDLLGHGKTGCLGYIHTMEAMAESVGSVLKKEQIHHFSLVGHSMGGYVALALAESFPNLITSLVLLNSTPEADNEERKKIRSRGIEAAKLNYRNVVRMSVGNLFLPECRETLKTTIENLKDEAVKTPLQGYIAAQEGMKIRKNRINFLKNTNFKKKVILGKKDSVLDFENTSKKLQDIDIELFVIDGGHMLHLEHPQQVLDRLCTITDH